MPRFSTRWRIRRFSPTSYRRRLRVLVADDNSDIAANLAAFLLVDGCETRIAHDGPEALALVEEFKPDAAIIDIAMPGMDGREVARAILDRHKGTRPMLIAISGEYEPGANEVLGEVPGFDYYLSKPFDAKVLLTLLAPLKSLRKRSLRPQSPGP
jgi:CheY-like chemotaxis protein